MVGQEEVGVGIRGHSGMRERVPVCQFTRWRLVWGAGVCACGNSAAAPAGARHARRLLERACEALNVFIMHGINNGSQVRPFERWEHLGWN